MTRLLQYLKNGEVVIGYKNGDEHILKATSSRVVLEFYGENGAGESAEDIARETINGFAAEIA